MQFGFTAFRDDESKLFISVVIVYSILEEIITVEVIAVGKRDDMAVYEKAEEMIYWTHGFG